MITKFELPKLEGTEKQVKWEEFLNYEEVRFFDKYGTYRLHRSETEIILQNTNNIGIMWALDLTEENFYKAYDECVRLFKGE